MSLYKAIGGYFELELNINDEYHKSALRLNTGRNAFEYILRAKNVRKVFLPYYTCDVMLEPVQKLKLDYEFYHIDESFSPVFNFSKLNKHEVFVYNNYFGICDKRVFEVSQKCKNLVIDNSQAFYAKPISGIDTFYSPRKFFGLPDGAYLYTKKKLEAHLEFDHSHNRMGHLLGRIEEGAEKNYPKFKDNENSLTGQPIKKMSKITQSLMKNIDYEKVASIRTNNFNYLHSKLKDTNEIHIELDSITVPMVYPYLVKNGSALKNKLISNKIFVATYWPNVKEWPIAQNSLERYLVENLVALPIDQRYNILQMSHILKLLKKL